MYPDPVLLLGVRWSVWNLMFLLGILFGYLVLRAAIAGRSSEKSPLLWFRYLVCVYVSALGAQWLAYLVDANSSLYPSAGLNVWRYYFDPLVGAKTLYGAVLILPLSIFAFVPWRGSSWLSSLNHATPALMTILGIARIGCFLQGCCYGVPTGRFGLRFATGSSVHSDQFLQGLVRADSPSLPVMPTQLIEAAVCFALSLLGYRFVRADRHDTFVRVLVLYSIFRFVIEFARADPARNHAAFLSTSQWIALAILTVVAMRSVKSLEAR